MGHRKTFEHKANIEKLHYNSPASWIVRIRAGNTLHDVVLTESGNKMFKCCYNQPNRNGKGDKEDVFFFLSGTSIADLNINMSVTVTRLNEKQKFLSLFVKRNKTSCGFYFQHTHKINEDMLFSSFTPANKNKNKKIRIILVRRTQVMSDKSNSDFKNVTAHSW